MEPCFARLALINNVSLGATAAVSERAAPRDPAASSNLDHFKIGLGRAAIGAFPVLRHILPARARGATVLGPALFFFVNKTTDHAHVRFHISMIAFSSS